MNNLTLLSDSTERLRKAIGECNAIANDLDDALKSAAKVLTPKNVKDSAERIARSAFDSATHNRARG